jgi:hypothetical protein
MDAVNPLNYARKPPPASRIMLWLYRVIFIGAMLAVLVFWGPGLWRWGNFLYWQHRCMIYRQSPAHLVLETSNCNILYSEFCPPLNSMQRYLDDRTADDGTVFLHEMQTPSGERRLVLLSISSFSQLAYDANMLRLEYREWSAAVNPQLLKSDEATFAGLESPFISKRHWKFFAAQPDTADPSHFTFDYDLDGARHTCDAWLKDDGQLIVSQRS